MAISSVIKYDEFEKVLLDDANRGWDNGTAGSCMFILADNTYTPATTHSTTTSLTGVITAGDGAPINVASPAIDAATTAGTTYLDSNDADFGSSVTITAKYLICIQPTAASTYSATTSKLLWYVDLDDTNSTTSMTRTASDFIITAPVNGWVNFT